MARHAWRWSILLAMGLAAPFAAIAAPGVPSRLHVITDDNFPPYLFRNDDGAVTGYLVDYWKLWESKTGVPVKLTATTWEDAQKRMLAGEADVIDMIFKTPRREPFYDFTAPYADLPVNLYSHKSIAGIADVNSIKGFLIGVEAGDACVEQLSRHGITNRVLYPNYAAMLAAAGRHEIMLFCMDQFPANFYLHKLQLEGEFLKSFNLYTGQFRRAVLKGHAETLHLVERGMAGISDAERKQLETKWFGEAHFNLLHAETRQILLVLGILGLAGMAVLAWNLLLRHQVGIRTSDLQRANDSLTAQQAILQRNELELNLSEERLHLALESARAGTWVWDVATNENSWSEETYRLYGYAPGNCDCSYEYWLAAVHPEDRDQAARIVAELSQQAKPIELEWRVNLPAGQERWLMSRGQPHFAPTGELVRYLGIVMDITERKQAEEQQRLWMQAFEQSDIGLSIGDPRHQRILAVNPAFAKRRGYMQDELVDQPISILFPPDRLAETMEHVRNAGEFGHVNFETEHLCKDGTRFPVMLDITVVKDAQGNPVSRFVYALDITERKIAEDQLLESREELRTLVTAIPDLVWFKDPEGVYLACNSRFEQFFGATEADIVGKTDYDFVDRDLADFFRAKDSLAIEAGGPSINEEELVFACDGHRELVQTIKTPVFDKSGVVVGVLGIARDITRMRENERELKLHREKLEFLVEHRTAELRESEARFRETANAAPALIWMSGTDKLCFFFNQGWLNFTGRSADQEIGNGWTEGVHPDDFDRCLEIYVRSFDARQPFSMEYRLRHHSGEYRWILDHGVPRFDNHSDFLGYIGACIDIEEIKRANAEREEARQAAEQLAKLKSEFLANMSHEIRTPLNGVLGLAQIGYRDNAGRDKAQESFSRILDSGRMLLAIVNDILDFSKIEAGKLNIENLPLDPAYLAEEAVSTLEAQASTNKLQLLCQKAPGLPAACLGDPMRIRQILLNLLSNAVKFTPQGEIRLVVHRQDDHLIFEVIDSGIGIAPEDIERLFKAFEQADGSTTRKFGGTGLGLAISHKLAELMGGNLTAVSEPGQGSTFTLKLPLHITDQAVVRAGSLHQRGASD